jgi:hypothetical protein
MPFSGKERIKGTGKRNASTEKYSDNKKKALPQKTASSKRLVPLNPAF